MSHIFWSVMGIFKSLQWMAYEENRAKEYCNFGTTTIVLPRTVQCHESLFHSTHNLNASITKIMTYGNGSLSGYL